MLICCVSFSCLLAFEGLHKITETIQKLHDQPYEGFGKLLKDEKALVVPQIKGIVLPDI